jgi:hypothetical protein
MFDYPYMIERSEIKILFLLPAIMLPKALDKLSICYNALKKSLKIPKGKSDAITRRRKYIVLTFRILIVIISHLSKEATHTKCIVFGLIRLEIEPTILCLEVKTLTITPPRQS